VLRGGFEAFHPGPLELLARLIFENEVAKELANELAHSAYLVG
jgi:hypothetical protein